MDRLNGKPPRNKAHEQSMHLTNEEEKELVHWITMLTQRGYAPRYRTVRELAEIIRNRRVFGEIRSSTPIEVTTPFKDSVLTSSPLNTEQIRSANAALLTEIMAGGVLSTPARNYT